MPDEIDTGWYAITDLELKQFHFAAIIAGGGDYVSDTVDRIRNRVIDFNTTEKIDTIIYGETGEEG